MANDEQTANERRLARREWRVVKTSLSVLNAVKETLPPHVALGMMWQLALDAWAMTGRALPDYVRSKTPVRRLSVHEVELRSSP